MATGELISDRSWHSSPSLNYSVSYETQRPNKYSTTVKVRFTVTVRSLYSSCSFGYPIYFSNTIDNQFRTITSSFGSGIKSVSYTSDWIEFSNAGASLSVGITPKCGDGGHTSYDTGTIYFDAYEEPQANITSLTVQSKTVDSVTFKYTTDRSANLYCSIDGGSTWLNNGKSFVSNTTSGTFTVYYKDRANTQKLDYNTSYTFRVLCRSTASGTDTSKDISATTYDIARISSLVDFEHGNNIEIGITNPANISNLSLVMKVGDTEILSRTVTVGTNTIEFSDIELDNLYKEYGSSSSLTATFVLTGSGYTNSKTCTVTLKGNQKTARTNVSSSWKRGKIWTNVSGTWKRTVIWTNVNGTWKRGI